MGMRPGQAKGPFVGPASGGGAGPSPASLTTTPAWYHVGVGVSHTALQAAALTNSITLFSLIAGGVIEGIVIQHSAAFGGGAISAYTLSVGLSGDLARYASAFNVFQAPGATIFEISGGLWSENRSAATSILLTGVSTGANLSASTSGAVDIWAKLSKAL